MRPREAESFSHWAPFGGDRELDIDMDAFLAANRVAQLSTEDAEELERRKQDFYSWVRKAARVAFATTAAHLPES